MKTIHVDANQTSADGNSLDVIGLDDAKEQISAKLHCELKEKGTQNSEEFFLVFECSLTISSNVPNIKWWH